MNNDPEITCPACDDHEVPFRELDVDRIETDCSLCGIMEWLRCAGCGLWFDEDSAIWSFSQPYHSMRCRLEELSTPTSPAWVHGCVGVPS